MNVAIMNTTMLNTATPQHSTMNDSDIQLRLTRRGRFIFLGIPALAALATVVLVVLALTFGAMASPAQAASAQEPVDMADYAATVTVLQGDSLWSIAKAADSQRDTREVLREIVAMNDLGTGILQAGQRLFVPLAH